MIKLFGYQELCVEFIKYNRGLILYHSMGSGKTITSLAMCLQFNKPIIIIATKASKKNFQDDMKKIEKYTNIDKSKITIMTYQKAITQLLEKQLDFTNKCVIIDEAHRLRNVTKLLSILISECANAYKLVLLTGTIFYNDLEGIKDYFLEHQN